MFDEGWGEGILPHTKLARDLPDLTRNKGGVEVDRAGALSRCLLDLSGSSPF